MAIPVLAAKVAVIVSKGASLATKVGTAAAVAGPALGKVATTVKTAAAAAGPALGKVATTIGTAATAAAPVVGQALTATAQTGSQVLGEAMNPAITMVAEIATGGGGRHSFATAEEYER